MFSETTWMEPDPTNAPEATNRFPALAQAVAAPLSRAAIFLVATLNPGSETRATLRSFCGDLAALVRAVEFRDLEGGLSCVVGFGSDAWDRLFGETYDMNNLHRELAPISDSAWAQIEEETSRTLKRYLAGRRVVDVKAPGGVGLSAVGTGHLRTITAPGEGIVARQREVKALVELRVPFELDRQALDDVDRGANDSDWQPAKDAARQIAFAEDVAIFDGYTAADIEGIRQGTSHPIMPLPAEVREYPDAIAQSLSRLRLVGVNGPYAALLGAEAYTALAETSDHGYPVLEHVKRLVKDQIIWAPAIAGAFVLTTRGGDFELHIGQDVSIGYLSHTEAAVRLYLQETFTFLLLTSEAALALSAPANAKKT